jgi:thymidine kinase
MVMNSAVGYLEVIAGPMYSGKTEEMIRQVKRAVIGKKRVAVFKHAIDTRYGPQKMLFSHAGMHFDSILAKTAQEISQAIAPECEIVAIDEAQWFGPEIIPLVAGLLERKLHVLVAGLALTFDRQPFVPMPQLLAMADKVTKLSAVCTVCGNDAVFHKRIKNGNPADPLTPDPTLVNTLSDNVYEARCRNCFDL